MTIHGEALRAHPATTAVEVRGALTELEPARPAYDTQPAVQLMLACRLRLDANTVRSRTRARTHSNSACLGLAAHALARSSRSQSTDPHPLALSLTVERSVPRRHVAWLQSTSAQGSVQGSLLMTASSQGSLLKAPLVKATWATSSRGSLFKATSAQCYLYRGYLYSKRLPLLNASLNAVCYVW